jgi:hemoglobin
MSEETFAIDEAFIERLVRTFYARAKTDPLLGPIFAARIQEWEPHLKTIIDFWSGVMLKTGRYRGNPLAVHVDLPITDEHFAHWIALFMATAEELGGAEAGKAFGARARMIGESLKLGIAATKGVYRKRS